MKSFRLTEEEMEYLADRYPTPFMVVSLDRVEKIIAISVRSYLVSRYFTLLRPIQNRRFCSAWLPLGRILMWHLLGK